MQTKAVTRCEYEDILIIINNDVDLCALFIGCPKTKEKIIMGACHRIFYYLI